MEQRNAPSVGDVTLERKNWSRNVVSLRKRNANFETSRDRILVPSHEEQPENRREKGESVLHGPLEVADRREDAREEGQVEAAVRQDLQD